MSNKIKFKELWNEVYAEAIKEQKLLQRRATGLLNYYIRLGYIRRGVCEVCDSTKTEGHHPDYNLPLDVVWLCRKHHKELHKYI